MKNLLVVPSKKIAVLAVVLAGVAGFGMVQAMPASADTASKTKQVKGDFTLQFYPPGSACAPWAGPCLKGTALATYRATSLFGSITAM